MMGKIVQANTCNIGNAPRTGLRNIPFSAIARTRWGSDSGQRS